MTCTKVLSTGTSDLRRAVSIRARRASPSSGGSPRSHCSICSSLSSCALLNIGARDHLRLPTAAAIHPPPPLRPEGDATLAIETDGRAETAFSPAVADSWRGMAASFRVPAGRGIPTRVVRSGTHELGTIVGLERNYVKVKRRPDQLLLARRGWRIRQLDRASARSTTQPRVAPMTPTSIRDGAGRCEPIQRLCSRA